MAGMSPARASPLIYPRLPAREAESELNLLKISRFLIPEAAFSRSSAQAAGNN
jgi:hypothetical protein